MLVGRLPGVNKDVSRMVFGTLWLSKSSEPFELLDSCRSLGCNAFDCAATYGDGKCEMLLGAWMRDRKVDPKDVVIISKGGCSGQEDLWAAHLADKAALRSEIVGSLNRLGVKELDLFMLHRDDPSVPVEKIVDYMAELQREGLFVTWGVSNWTTARLEAAVAYADQVRLPAPLVSSVQDSLAQPSRPVWPGTSFMSDEDRAWYTKNSPRVSVLAWEVLAKGFLTGRFDRAEAAEVQAKSLSTTTSGDKRKREDESAFDDTWRERQIVDAYCIERNFARRDRAQELADESLGARSLAQVSLNFVLSQDYAPFVLVGSTSSQHLSENFRVGGMERLTQDELLFLQSSTATCGAMLDCASSAPETTPVVESASGVESVDAIPTPIQLHAMLPLTPRAHSTVCAARAAVAKIVHCEKSDGGDKLLCVVGPCSIHDIDAALEYAGQLAKLRETYKGDLEVVMRVYFEKPRTTVGWKGLINDPNLDATYDVAAGLKSARGLLRSINELGLPCATEFLDPFSPHYYADLISWGAIGARTTESQIHREMASSIACPIGFKNSTSGDVKVAMDAIKSSRSSHRFIGLTKQGTVGRVQSLGNPDGHVILRGGSNGPNFEAEHVNAAFSKINTGDNGTTIGVVVDCSHGNSCKVHTNQPLVAADLAQQIRKGNDGIVGVMIESHINAGNQKHTPGVHDPAKLKYGVSITDACIDLESTASVLAELAAAVRARRALKQ